MTKPDIMTLAQLTDVHLGPLPPFWPQHWNAKRFLGYINFHVKRRAFNDPSRVHALVADLKAQHYDHVAVTGDLANLGMPAELENSLAWLATVGSPANVTVIPGNHDIYTPLVQDKGIERWRPYMRARDGQDQVSGLPQPLPTGFPFVRTFGAFALIGLNSAVCMPPGVAAGRAGDAQLARFAEISLKLREEGYARIVLIHHPPLKEHGPRGLRDAAAFELALASVGAELVLHGHNHRQMLSWRASETGPVPIIGAASAGEGAYNMYRLARRGDGSLEIEVITRAGNGADVPFRETGRMVLDPADQPVT